MLKTYLREWHINAIINKPQGTELFGDGADTEHWNWFDLSYPNAHGQETRP